MPPKPKLLIGRNHWTERATNRDVSIAHTGREMQLRILQEPMSCPCTTASSTLASK